MNNTYQNVGTIVNTNGFTLHAEQLKAIKKAITRIKKTDKIEVLENVKFTFNCDQLIFEAQDTLNYIKMEFNHSTSSEKDQIVMNKKVLKDMKLKKGETAIFKVDSDNNSEFELSMNGMNIKYFQTEFANISETNFTKNPAHTVNKGYLQSLKNAIKFTSPLESRPILQGVCHNEKHIYSTDSHQLYHNSNLHSLENYSISIHHASCKVITDMFLNENLTFTISNDERYVKYENNNTLFISKLIEGNYPEVKRLFPTNHRTTMTLYNNQINELLETFKMMSRHNKGAKGNYVVNLVSDIASNNLQVDCKDNNMNKLEQNFNVEIKGEELKISFNAKNVLNVLEQQKKRESITFQFTGSMSPFIVIVDGSSEKYLYSPVRTW